MEDLAAGKSFEAPGAEQAPTIGEPSGFPIADDALGDEAAFPMTWQHLTSGAGPRD